MAKKKTETAPRSASDRLMRIGGSDLGALMGVHPSKTPLDVYNAVLGLKAGEPENYHMKRGKLFEPVAAQQYTEKTGIKLVASQIEIVDPDHPYFMGHIDYLKDIPAREPAEIKVPGLRKFSEYKRKGLPAHLICQLQGYMGLLNLQNLASGIQPVERGEWILFNSELVETKNFEVEFEAALFIKLRGVVVRFFENHIEKRIPPPKKLSTAESREFQTVGGEMTQIDSPAFEEGMSLLREVRRLKEDHAYLEEVAKEKLRAAVSGAYGKYEGVAGRFYFTQRPGRLTIDKDRLIAAEPIDRKKLEEAVAKAFGKGPYKKLIELLDSCRVDLADFMKQGQPYDQMNSYFVEDTE